MYYRDILFNKYRNIQIYKKNILKIRYTYIYTYDRTESKQFFVFLFFSTTLLLCNKFNRLFLLFFSFGKFLKGFVNATTDVLISSLLEQRLERRNDAS